MSWVLAILLAGAGGLVGGLVGVGGGILFVPAMTIFLDLSQVQAESTSLLMIAIVALVGAARQRSYGNVNLRDAVTIGLLSPLGVGVGVVVSNAVPERVLQLGFAALALFFASRLVRRALAAPRGARVAAFATGAMSDGLSVPGGPEIPLAEIELKTSRSSGPGGQHANVTASRVEAVFDVEASAALSDSQRRRLLERLGSRVSAVAQDARGQARNRELALERLAAKLADGLREPKARRPTRPTRAAKQRRLDQKRRAGERKRTRRRPDADD